MNNRKSWTRRRRQGSHAVWANQIPSAVITFDERRVCRIFSLLPLQNLTSPILPWILRYRLEQEEDLKQEVGRVLINEWRLFEVLPDGQTCFCFYVSRKTETFLFFYFCLSWHGELFFLDYIYFCGGMMSRGRVLELEFYTYPYKPRFRFSWKHT